jgi:hypothetical protein
MKISLECGELFEDTQINFILTVFSLSCSMNRIMSSAYSSIKTHLSTKWGMRLPTWTSSSALVIQIAIISTTILKSQRDKRSPYCKPFIVWKWCTILLLSLIPTYPPSTKCANKSQHSGVKSFIHNVWWRKDHLTLSSEKYTSVMYDPMRLGRPCQ